MHAAAGPPAERPAPHVALPPADASAQRVAAGPLLCALLLVCCSRSPRCAAPLSNTQELGDKFAWTVRLHNGLAACQMRMGRWEDAEGELLQVGACSGLACTRCCFGWLGMGAAGHPGRPRETWRTGHAWHPGRNPRMSEC